MNQSFHKLRLSCCFFSGEDDFIIRKCNRHIQSYFASIGILVIFVFVLCWISAAIFMSHVFAGTRWLSIPIGILWAMLITNLYLLLLYTISPALLPVAEKKGIIKEETGIKHKKAKYLLFNISFLARLSFILFLAMVIAQPFNVSIFSSEYNVTKRFAASIREILDSEPLAKAITISFCVIMSFPVFLKYRIRAISRKYFEKDFKTPDVTGMRYLREQIGNPTDYQHLVRQILSVDINAIRTSDFYFQKTLIEYRMVLEEYQQFKKDYSRLLSEKIVTYNHKCNAGIAIHLHKLKNINPEKHDHLSNQMKAFLQSEVIEKYEYWADPPFRTCQKSVVRKLASEANLLKMFYADS